MEEFFNKFVDALFEIFTNFFSFAPFKVFILCGALLVFIVYFIQSLISRRRDK